MHTANKSSWVIGGGLIAGLGAGFFFLPTNALGFVACLLIGLGGGLIASVWMEKTAR